MFCIVFFFFKQKTAYEMRISDWSSDVCSSDLMSNANGIAATDGIDYFYLEDITESKASAASADISEAQAVIATSEAAAAQASSEMSAQLASPGYLEIGRAHV